MGREEDQWLCKNTGPDDYGEKNDGKLSDEPGSYLFAVSIVNINALRATCCTNQESGYRRRAVVESALHRLGAQEAARSHG